MFAYFKLYSNSLSVNYVFCLSNILPLQGDQWNEVKRASVEVRPPIRVAARPAARKPARGKHSQFLFQKRICWLKTAFQWGGYQRAAQHFNMSRGAGGTFLRASEREVETSAFLLCAAVS